MQVYTKEQRRIHLAEWKELGISGKEFCRQKNIKPSTFYSWLKIERQLEKKKSSSANSSFIPVKVAAQTDQKISADQITLERKGYKIYIPLTGIEKTLPMIISAFEKIHVS